MGIEREPANERKKLPEDVWTSLADLYHDQKTVTDLVSMRRTSLDRQEIELSSYRPALYLLQRVYLAFEPVSDRLIRARFKNFRKLRPSEVEDIRETQRLKLWELFILRFKWEIYSLDKIEQVAFSLLSYLKTMTGSFFASGVIESEFPPLLVELMEDKKAKDPLSVLLSEENGVFIAGVLQQWIDETGELNRNVLCDLYFEEMTIEEIARKDKVSIEKVRGRIKTAKASLAVILRQNNVQLPEKQLLLDQRAGFVLSKYKRWKEYFPPRVREAVEYYFGLEGKEATFNIKRTAEAMGVLETAVRTYLSLALALMTGKTAVGLKVTEAIEGKELYRVWTARSELVGLNEKEKQLLEMNFGQGLSIEEISVKLSEERTKIQRRKESALAKIRIAGFR